MVRTCYIWNGASDGTLQSTRESAMTSLFGPSVSSCLSVPRYIHSNIRPFADKPLYHRLMIFMVIYQRYPEFLAPLTGVLNPITLRTNRSRCPAGLCTIRCRILWCAIAKCPSPLSSCQRPPSLAGATPTDTTVILGAGGGGGTKEGGGR